MGAKTIQAYVTQVRSKVKLTPDIRPDDLILKAEEIGFLEQTRLDESHPETYFTVTSPGQYPLLLEHIAVHRYFMGIDEQCPIPYEETVCHWHDAVYQPVVQVIRERGILRHFPGRTETDLYLWLSQHRAELEKALGWHIHPEAAALDLKTRFSVELSNSFARLASRTWTWSRPTRWNPVHRRGRGGRRWRRCGRTDCSPGDAVDGAHHWASRN